MISSDTRETREKAGGQRSREHSTTREKADIKAKLEEARQRRLALENSRYGDMKGSPSDACVCIRTPE